MISAMIVNLGNYLYNLIVGRMLGPSGFADASLLVTMLLVLSFLAMTFQLTAAKFSAEMDGEESQLLVSLMSRYGLVVGAVISLCMVLFSNQLQLFFQSQSAWMYIIFALCVPLYFLMSVGRGHVQGIRNFRLLSISYQVEMLIRLCGTVALLRLLDVDPAISISLGILASVALGYLPIRNKRVMPISSAGRITKTLLVFATYTLAVSYTHLTLPTILLV